MPATPGGPASDDRAIRNNATARITHPAKVADLVDDVSRPESQRPTNHRRIADQRTAMAAAIATVNVLVGTERSPA